MTVIHESDCSMHDAPATSAGPCNCSSLTRLDVADDLRGLLLVLPMIEAQRQVILSAEALLRVRPPETDEEKAWAAKKSSL